MSRVLPVFALLFLLALPAAAADPLQAFPPPEAGMRRVVIDLPPQPDESELKVELVVGKTVRTDPTNRYFFAGQLETESLPGWGYERHVLRQLGPMAGTLIAVPPQTPQVERFVALGGEARLLRYNSRLPLVVDVPEGVEVRHRLWRAEAAAPRSHTLALPAGQTAVVAEGAGEARSIGSYDIRIYAAGARAGDNTTFFTAGLLRPRQGSLERVWLADLGAGLSLIVAIRAAGSGGYLSAEAFQLEGATLALQASVSGLAADADVVMALRRVLGTASH